MISFLLGVACALVVGLGSAIAVVYVCGKLSCELSGASEQRW